MNTELVKAAMLKVGDPNFLVNLVSRRVRQLNNPGSKGSRPLFIETAGMGIADIAMAELIHDKMGFEIPEPPKATDHAPKKKSRKHH
ncbi:MAG: DNA-directed RNA polymerase subunit omega [Verrucomicrobia bacterium]|nr:DNA-directed RNA polymerase subunit omega [Verrucomicrobiota bacterium]